MSESAPPVARVLRFDAFELDLYAGELRKRGIKLRLQGQPVQVLAMLLQSAGNLVTREEIRNQLWHADTFVDFDHSLHNAIARIRDVLGDSAQTPKYIETLPRRGYRYIGPVQDVPKLEVAAETGDHPAQLVALITPAKQQRRHLVLVLCALFTLGSLPGQRGGTSTRKRRFTDTFHCCPAPQEFLWRFVRGILRGWHHGPVDYGPG